MQCLNRVRRIIVLSVLEYKTKINNSFRGFKLFFINHQNKGNQLRWQSARLACERYRDRCPGSPGRLYRYILLLGKGFHNLDVRMFLSGWPSGLRRQTQEVKLFPNGAFWSTNVGVGSNPTSDTSFADICNNFVNLLQLIKMSTEPDLNQRPKDY